jgi:hypothetical protein
MMTSNAIVLIYYIHNVLNAKRKVIQTMKITGNVNIVERCLKKTVVKCRIIMTNAEIIYSTKVGIKLRSSHAGRIAQIGALRRRTRAAG